MEISITLLKSISLTFGINEILIADKNGDSKFKIGGWMEAEFNEFKEFTLDGNSYFDVIEKINCLPILKQSKYRNTLNWMYANKFVCININESNSPLAIIQATSIKAKCITKDKCDEQIHLNKTFSIRKQDDRWRIEDSHGFIALEWISDDSVAFFELVGQITTESFISTNLSDSKRNIIEIIRYLMLENSFCSQRNNRWIKYWDYHDLVFDAMTRNYSDHVIRSGNYRFKPEECETDADLEVCTKSGQYIEKSNEARNSYRITRDESNKIEDRVIIELYRRAFMNIEVDNHIYVRSRKSKMVHRPYPSAGNIHELRYYHLELVDSSDDNIALREFIPSTGDFQDIEELKLKSAYDIFKYVQGCWQTNDVPRYLLLIISNFPVISYKYKNIAYRLTLLNTGCALSSFYKACDSLGIGCCATGTGLSENIIENIKADRYQLIPTMEVGFGLSH